MELSYLSCLDTGKEVVVTDVVGSLARDVVDSVLKSKMYVA